jgi:hypothetical protein
MKRQDLVVEVIYAPLVGGSEMLAFNLCREWQTSGIKARICCLYERSGALTSSFDEAGIPYDLLDIGGHGLLGRWMRTIRSFLRVRPRALTLTMFVRLLLSDLFIHGIGGALYDQMTDQIMDQLFGVRPAYACASAGWLLPIAGHIDQSHADISQLKWRQHHLRSNPEQLAPKTALPGQALELSKQRHDLITSINQSLIADRREHRRRGLHWLQRRADFRQLHEINARLLTLFDPQVNQIASQMTSAELTQKNLSVASWREYFIALHPRASLQQLVAVIRSKAT